MHVDVPDIGFATRGDLSLAYSDLDGGPHTLIMVPGLCSHLEQAWLCFPQFGRLIGRLNQFARVVWFDKRGTGMSDRIEGAPSLEERATDIEIIMEATGIERATLVAYSEGAAIATLFAASHPERVSSLVVGGAYARFRQSEDYPWGTTPEEMEYLLGPFCDEWGTGIGYTRWIGGEPDQEERDRWARFERACCTPTTLRRLFTFLKDLDIRDVLPAVSCPTLVVQERDDVVPGNLTYFSDHISTAELIVFEGSSHVPWLSENFEDWVNAIARFVTGVDVGDVSVDRVLAAIVFTDIVDSTRQAVTHGDTTWRRMLDHYDQLAGELSQRFAGRVVKSTGDGTLAVFDGPARAIRYADALMTATGEQLGLELRAGAHVGEIELRGDDIGGINVHIASRVQARAGPTEILTSSVVEQLCLGSGVEFEPAGTHELRGVPGSWNLRRVTYTPRAEHG